MALAFVISVLAVAGFGLALGGLKILAVAQGVMQVTTEGLGAMLDGELDDDAKERAVRRAGFGLIIAAFNIFWRIAAALALAALPIVIADALGLVRAADVLALMLRAEYIFVVSVVAIAGYEVWRRIRSDPAANRAATNRYSATDRFFHALAFSSPLVLKAAAALENRLYRRPEVTAAQAPIFITSLARGGTTALLNACHALPGIATHTYRDMPFVTAPLLWRRLTGDKRQVARHQRAHGDGLSIDLDSPEAFEEVIWKLFWPGRYRGRTIPLWAAQDRNARAERFLTDHMARLIRARNGVRYCSKNNANIARLPYLQAAFPACRIVVPLRRPESHAASLLRQHMNFLTLQQDDDFVRRYMRDIGHFEFGKIHKPLAFPGFDPAAFDPQSPDYWLSYWISAVRHVLAHQEDCIFVLQSDLRETPQATMTRLCTALDLDPAGQDFRPFFRAGADDAPRDVYAPALMAAADDLYQAIRGSGRVV